MAIDSYRGQLEVLKCLAPTEVLETTCLISKSWCKTSGSEELWMLLCMNAGFSHMNIDQFKTSWKDSYHLGAVYSTNLVLLWKSSLALFNCKTSKMNLRVHLSEELLTIDGIRLCFLGCCVFCCGGGSIKSSLKNSYLISSITGYVQSERPMKHPRKNHGIISHSNSVYVFGGMHSLALRKSSECFDIDKRRWRVITGMITPRVDFQPCVAKDRIYLAGGQTDKVEIFDIKTEQFTSAPFTLIEIGRAISFVFNNSLTICTQNRYQTWDFSSSKTGSTVHSLLDDSPGDMTPVSLDGKLYCPVAAWGLVIQLTLGATQVNVIRLPRDR